MTGLIISIHVIVCALLIALILIQRGRGGGLLESFTDVESIFGTKTDAFLSRATSILSTVFFITCLSLAFFSARQSRSLLKDAKVAPAAQEAPKQEESAKEAKPQGAAEQPKTQEVPKTK